MFHHLLLTLAACGGSPAPEPKPEVAPEVVPEPVEEAAPAFEVPAQHAALFKPVQAIPVPPKSKAVVELGRMLYYETRLSKGQDLSCNSCHVLDAYGVDNKPTSPGHKGQLGSRNSPTVYHAFSHVAQFWDGREPDVEAQAKGPILNPVEMAMPDGDAVVALLNTIPGYHTAFASAFPTESAISYDHVGTAIGAFERYLVTPSPFDAYLLGDGDAIPDEAKKGLDTFIATGCTTCHSGQDLGGAMFMKLGLVEPYKTADLGRYEVTKNDADKYVFKVPSLRNIAKTGPYFHDGSIATLEEAVTLMAKHQLGRELAPEDVSSIVAFLDTLTGKLDKAYIAEPTLPPNGPDTPGPSL